MVERQGIGNAAGVIRVTPAAPNYPATLTEPLLRQDQDDFPAFLADGEFRGAARWRGVSVHFGAVCWQRLRVLGRGVCYNDGRMADGRMADGRMARYPHFGDFRILSFVVVEISAGWFAMGGGDGGRDGVVGGGLCAGQ